MRKKIIVLIIVFLTGIISLLLIYNIHQEIQLRKLVETIEENDYSRFSDCLGKIRNVDSPSGTFVERFLSEDYFDTPLQAACRIGNVNMVKDILEKGADVNYVHDYVAPFSPLMCAAGSESENNLEIVKCLIANGADVNYSINERNDALCRVVDRNIDRPNSVEIINLLITNGASLERQYPKGSILDVAVFWGNDEIIFCLEMHKTGNGSLS